LIKIFIGYDPREAVAYHVLCHSIHARASQPVSIVPLMLSELGALMTRERNPLQSTDFSFSRFLAPYLNDFSGWAIFMDCDMLVLDDIANLWNHRDDQYALMCVKHDHVPNEDTKFLGAVQTTYEKKNWSSVMMFNADKCTALSPEYVNSATGLDLHRFRWLDSDDQIGELPHRWNHLVDYDPPEAIENISNLHYTIGGPYFESYKGCGYADEWNEERERMLFAG
jgi:hypothetical protein